MPTSSQWVEYADLGHNLGGWWQAVVLFWRPEELLRQAGEYLFAVLETLAQILGFVFPSPSKVLCECVLFLFVLYCLYCCYFVYVFYCAGSISWLFSSTVCANHQPPPHLLPTAHACVSALHQALDAHTFLLFLFFGLTQGMPLHLLPYSSLVSPVLRPRAWYTSPVLPPFLPTPLSCATRTLYPSLHSPSFPPPHPTTPHTTQPTTTTQQQQQLK